jgi:NAD+ synthase
MKLPRIDTWQVENYLCDFIRNYLEKSGCSRVVVGLSGGIDSAATAALAQAALGSRNVRGLILPYRDGNPADVEDALLLCRTFKLKSRVIDISPMIEAYFHDFPRANWMRRGNKMARERMSILYDWAAYHDALVLGTSNKTELLLGYFTKYGDGAVDLEPLGGLYKCEVRQLASSLGVPEKLVNRTPTAGLWKGQTDEKELGFGYDLLDSLLYLRVEKNYHPSRLIEKGFTPEAIQAVQERVDRNSHKLRLPPSAVIPAAWRKLN